MPLPLPRGLWRWGDQALFFSAVITACIAQPFYEFVLDVSPHSGAGWHGVAAVALFQLVLPATLAWLSLSRGRVFVEFLTVAIAIYVLQRITLRDHVMMEASTLARGVVIGLSTAGLTVALLALRRLVERWLRLMGAVFPILGVIFVVQASTLDSRPVTSAKPAVMLLILDELNLPALLGDDGRVDRAAFPNFARLADESLWFRQAMTNNITTSASIPAMLLGRIEYSPEGGNHNMALYGDKSLPAILRAAGYGVLTISDLFYCSGDFHCASSPEGATSLSGLVARFFYRTAPYTISEKYIPALMVGWGFRPTLSAMEAAARSVSPGHLYIFHTLLSHNPFILDGTLDHSQPFSHPDGMFEADAAFHHRMHRHFQAVDTWLGDLLDDLRRSGQWDKMVFALVADHGSCWTLDCNRAHLADSSSVVRRELVNIPMFLHGAEIVPGINDGDSQLVDLLPTLLDAAGMASATPEGAGVSLLKPAAAEGRRRKLILGYSPSPWGVDLPLPLTSTRFQRPEGVPADPSD